MASRNTAWTYQHNNAQEHWKMKKFFRMKNTGIFAVLKNIVDGTGNDSSGSGIPVDVDLSASPVELYVQLREWLRGARLACGGGMDGAQLFVRIDGHAGGNEEVLIEWHGTWTPGRVVCMTFSSFDGSGGVGYITGTGDRSRFIDGLLEGVEAEEGSINESRFIWPIENYER